MPEPVLVETDDENDGAWEQTPRRPQVRPSHDTPPKQETLTSLWQVATKRPPWTPPSHTRLLGALSEKKQRAFHESLEEVKRRRAQEAAERQRTHNRKLRAGKADMTPPEEAGRGVKRGPDRNGRPSGTARVYGRNQRKPLGAPVLRRDPSTQEKLAIVFVWAKACAKAGVESIKDLCADTRTRLQAQWHWSWTVV